MSGELRVGVGIHQYSSPTLTNKHYVDGSVTKQGKLTNVLHGNTGTPILFEGKKVYISDKGQRLLDEWRQKDNLPEGVDIAVFKESVLGNIGDWIMGNQEED